MDQLQEKTHQCFLLSTRTLQAYCDPSTFSSAPLCTPAFRNALQLIGRTYPEKQAKKFRKRYPDFVNALFSFALRSRREADISQIERSLKNCHCRESWLEEYTPTALRYLHTTYPHPTFGPSPYPVLAYTLGLIFVQARALFKGLHSTTLHNAASKNGEGKRQYKGLQQMIFYLVGEGVRYTVSSSFMWYKRTQYPIITGLVLSCLIHSPSRFIPDFLAHSDAVPVYTSSLQRFINSQQPKNAILTFHAYYEADDLQMLLATLCYVFINRQLVFTESSALPKYLGNSAHSLYNAIIGFVRLNGDEQYITRLRLLIGESYEDDVGLTLLVAFAQAIRDSMSEIELASWPIFSQ